MNGKVGSLRRAPDDADFALVVPVATVRDDRLSYRARGILARLLTNRADYVMAAEDLAEGEGCEGREAIRTGLRELAKLGYLKRIAKKNGGGKFTGWETWVYATPRECE